MQLTYDESVDISDIKFIPSKRIPHSLQPGKYENSDLNKALEDLLPTNVKISITIDDIKLKSKLNDNQTLISTKKSFFYPIIGFTQSQLGVIGHIEGFVQKIPVTYKSEKPLSITGIDKIHLK